MANLCNVEFCIAGKKENVKQFIEELPLYERFYKNSETVKGDYIEVRGCGDVKWSVASALRNSQEQSYDLEQECAKLNIACEIFSEEPGCGFQEHFLYAKGLLIIDERVNFEEWYPADMTEEELEDLGKRRNISLEILKKYAEEEEYFIIGGFLNYMEFQPLLENYFEIDNKEEEEQIEISKDTLIYNLIILLYEQNIKDYKGLDEPEFIDMVVEKTGISLETYNSLMFGKERKEKIEDAKFHIEPEKPEHEISFDEEELER